MNEDDIIKRGCEHLIDLFNKQFSTTDGNKNVMGLMQLAYAFGVKEGVRGMHTFTLGKDPATAELITNMALKVKDDAITQIDDPNIVIVDSGAIGTKH